MNTRPISGLSLAAELAGATSKQARDRVLQRMREQALSDDSALPTGDDVRRLGQLIAACGGAAERLLRRDSSEHRETVALLEVMISDLETRRASAANAVRLAAEIAERPIVRDRVLRSLSAPRRPVEVVDALGLDPSEVARGLAELRDANLIVALAQDEAEGRDRPYVVTEQAPRFA